LPFEVGLLIDIDSRRARAGAGEVERSLRAVSQEARRTEGTVGRAGKSMEGAFDRLKRSAFSLKGALAGLGVGLLVREVIQAATAMERIQNSLRAATGSAEAAGREFRFVREQSKRLGLDLESSARQFAQLAAAARGTALEGRAARDIFTAVAEASTVMGLSADQAGGALTAIQQIISKGTVSAEELRGQLGERLPGAFQIAARSIGVTTAELGKLLATGKLTAEQLLPALAREMHRTFGSSVEQAARSTQAEINRFRTSIFELKAEFAQSGFIEGFTDAMGELSAAMSDPGFRSSMREFGSFVGESLTFMAQNAEALKTVFAALTGAFLGGKIGGIAGPRGSAVGAGLGALVGLLATMSDEAKSATEVVTEFGTATDFAFGAGSPLAEADGKVTKFVDALKRQQEQLELLDDATRQGGRAVENANDAIAVQNALLKAGVSASTDEGQAILKLVVANNELERSIDATTDARREAERASEKAQRDLERQAERAAEAAERPLKVAAENIQNTFSDAFFNIFRKGELSFKSLTDSIKDIFARTLAELAVLALREPVIIPMVGGAAGRLGLGDAA